MVNKEQWKKKKCLRKTFGEHTRCLLKKLTQGAEGTPLLFFLIFALLLLQIFHLMIPKMNHDDRKGHVAMISSLATGTG